MIVMKSKFLLIINTLTFVFFSVYFYLNTSECVAFYMHDASINVSPSELITICFYLFIGPVLMQSIQIFILRKPIGPISIIQYVLGLLSIVLLTNSINKPCEFINGGHFMFVEFGTTILSYLLRYICYLLLGLTILRTLLNIIVRK